MKHTSTSECTPDSAGVLDLGVVLGQNQAFAILAGRCSAAQAAGLHRLRERETYKAAASTWDEFCSKFLKMSRSEADRIIRLWEEFGAPYFEIAQWTRLSPETYRAIAPAVHDGALHANGEAIELNADNARKVAAAVADLRRAIPANKRAAAPEMHERIAVLDRRCTALLAEFEEISRKERHGENWLAFSRILVRAHSSISRIARENGIA